MNFTVDHIYACKTVLEDESSTAEDRLQQLRILSVMHVSQEHLLETKIGHVVKKLRKNGDAEVAKLAQRLLDKWMAQMLQERSSTSRTKTLSTPYTAN